MGTYPPNWNRFLSNPVQFYSSDGSSKARNVLDKSITDLHEARALMSLVAPRSLNGFQQMRAGAAELIHRVFRDLGAPSHDDVLEDFRRLHARPSVVASDALVNGDGIRVHVDGLVLLRIRAFPRSIHSQNKLRSRIGRSRSRV